MKKESLTLARQLENAKGGEITKKIKLPLSENVIIGYPIFSSLLYVGVWKGEKTEFFDSQK